IRTTDLAELGLREYVTQQPKSNLLAGVTYVPLTKDNAALIGETQSIGCQITATVSDLDKPLMDHLYRCATSFRTHDGLALTIAFQPILLPQWRELSREVEHFINSILVKDTR
ncbi:hypothetical protein, partial [Pseudomonas nitroreducens]|uniref:hypothetical protein n=1 Tax=Pseudomonas nitroreducens TaxID=46680 RepID=UPI001A8F28BF